MNSNGTTTTNNTTAKSSGLSKSQKKRMKRNAKKQKDAQAKQPKKSTDGESLLNPHEKLRANLVSLGYPLAEIDEVLEEMWNLQLQYDEVESVLAYIQQRSSTQSTATSSATTGVTDSSNDNGAEDGIAPTTIESTQDTKDDNAKATTAATAVVTVQEETTNSTKIDMNPTTSSTITATSSSSLSSSNLIATNNNDMNEGIIQHDVTPIVSIDDTQKETTTTEESTTTTTAVTPDNSKDTPLSDLDKKLEMVANHDSLADAIMALTDWVVKAATAMEVKDFCSSTALHTVITRSILTPENLIGQLLDLIGSTLRTTGVPPTHLSSSAKSLGSLIIKARTARAMKCNATLVDTVASSIAQQVVTQMSKTVQNVFNMTQNGDALVLVIQGEVEELTASMVQDVGGGSSGAGAGAGELMSRRDYHKIAAEKYLTIAGIMIGMVPANNNQGEEETLVNGATNGNYDKYMACLLGDQYTQIVSSRTKYDSLKRKLQESNSSYVSDRDALTSEIENLTTEKSKTSKRIQELKAELQRLTCQEETLETKISEAKGKKLVLEQSLSGSARETEDLLRQYSDKVNVEESISEVADSLKEFCDSLRETQEKCTSSQSAPTFSESIGKATNSMESFLLRMKSYFESEFKMVQFLRNRAMTLEEKTRSLEREIEECTMLGMSTNVTQMAKNLKETEQYLNDDNTLAEALKGEAMKMTQNLTDQLNQYRSMMEKVGSSTVASVGVILNDIKKTIDGLGLPEDSRFIALVNSFALPVNGYDNYFPDPTLLMNNGTNGHVAASAATTNETEISGHVIMDSRKETVELKPASRSMSPAKKSSAGWGNGHSSSTTTTKPTKSFLDIQNEERSMKLSN